MIEYVLYTFFAIMWHANEGHQEEQLKWAFNILIVIFWTRTYQELRLCALVLCVLLTRKMGLKLLKPESGYFKFSTINTPYTKRMEATFYSLSRLYISGSNVGRVLNLCSILNLFKAKIDIKKSNTHPWKMF